ncbi:MAG TPA: hypothetical protein VFP80_13650 [Thermoanaerobaculia bacterium]|nr:hypothetical protein [Thermoanaerobaculia bacterium]
MFRFRAARFAVAVLSLLIASAVFGATDTTHARPRESRERFIDRVVRVVRGVVTHSDIPTPPWPRNG